jgi:hypothetical protein
MNQTIEQLEAKLGDIGQALIVAMLLVVGTTTLGPTRVVAIAGMASIAPILLAICRGIFDEFQSDAVDRSDQRLHAGAILGSLFGQIGISAIGFMPLFSVYQVFDAMFFGFVGRSVAHFVTTGRRAFELKSWGGFIGVSVIIAAARTAWWILWSESDVTVMESIVGSAFYELAFWGIYLLEILVVAGVMQLGNHHDEPFWNWIRRRRWCAANRAAVDFTIQATFVVICFLACIAAGPLAALTLIGIADFF